MAYQLEGKLLEVCDCNVLCPCWIGEDPDNGTCRSMQAYHIERGRINEVDVSGLTIAEADFIPGNILKGNIRVEKNLPWGRRMSKPLGILLLTWGITLAVSVQFFAFY